MDSVTQAIFVFQFTIPLFFAKQVRSSLLLHGKCVDGKEEVKAVMLQGNIKDLNAKIWKEISSASVANGMNNLILSKKAEFINTIFCAAWVTTTTKTKNNNCSWNRICTCHNMRSYLAGLCLKRAPSSFLEESNTSEESVWPPLSCNLVENKHEG